MNMRYAFDFISRFDGKERGALHVLCSYLWCDIGCQSHELVVRQGLDVSEQILNFGRQ